jgi:hypothetical protein
MEKCEMTCTIYPDVAQKRVGKNSNPDAYDYREFFVDYIEGQPMPQVAINVYFKSAGRIDSNSHGIRVTCNPPVPFSSQTFSKIETVSVSVSAPTVLTFYDYNDNYAVVRVYYKARAAASGAVDTPVPATFTPASGATVPASVSISTPLGVSAKIYYTIDGSVPKRDSTLYTGAITVSSPCRLRTLIVPNFPDIVISGKRYVQSYQEASYAAVPVATDSLRLTFTHSANNYAVVSGNETMFQGNSTYVKINVTPLAVPHKIYYSLGEGNSPNRTSPVYTPGCIKLTETSVVRAFAVPDGDGVFGGKKYSSCPILYMKFFKSNSSGKACMPPVFDDLVYRFDGDVTPILNLLDPGSKMRYTINGGAPKSTDAVLLPGQSFPTITEDAVIRAIVTKRGMPDSAETIIKCKKMAQIAISNTPTTNQSNIVPTTLGLRFIVASYVGGYVCKMFVPQFPRTIVDGVVAGGFDSIGIVSTMTATPTMILLVEEPYGSLLTTIYLSDNSIKRFRSFSNGKTWTDVTSEVVL